MDPADIRFLGKLMAQLSESYIKVKERNLNMANSDPFAVGRKFFKQITYGVVVNMVRNNGIPTECLQKDDNTLPARKVCGEALQEKVNEKCLVNKKRKPPATVACYSSKRNFRSVSSDSAVEIGDRSDEAMDNSSKISLKSNESSFIKRGNKQKLDDSQKIACSNPEQAFSCGNQYAKSPQKPRIPQKPLSASPPAKKQKTSAAKKTNKPIENIQLNDEFKKFNDQKSCLNFLNLTIKDLLTTYHNGSLDISQNELSNFVKFTPAPDHKNFKFEIKIPTTVSNGLVTDLLSVPKKQARKPNQKQTEKSKLLFGYQGSENSTKKPIIHIKDAKLKTGTKRKQTNKNISGESIVPIRISSDVLNYDSTHFVNLPPTNQVAKKPKTRKPRAPRNKKNLKKDTEKLNQKNSGYHLEQPPLETLISNNVNFLACLDMPNICEEQNKIDNQEEGSANSNTDSYDIVIQNLYNTEVGLQHTIQQKENPSQLSNIPVKRNINVIDTERSTIVQKGNMEVMNKNFTNIATDNEIFLTPLERELKYNNELDFEGSSEKSKPSKSPESGDILSLCAESIVDSSLYGEKNSVNALNLSSSRLTHVSHSDESSVQRQKSVEAWVKSQPLTREISHKNSTTENSANICLPVINNREPERSLPQNAARKSINLQARNQQSIKPSTLNEITIRNPPPNLGIHYNEEDYNLHIVGTNHYRNLPELGKFFNITCLPSLVDKCDHGKVCKLSHKLRDIPSFQLALSELRFDQVCILYKFAYRFKKLYVKYFDSFCEYYCQQKKFETLCRFVEDCERYPDFLQQKLFVIFQCFVKCGFSKEKAYETVLNHTRKRTEGTINALMNIFVESNWMLFIKHIDDLLCEPNIALPFNIISRMAETFPNRPNRDVASAFCKCCLHIHKDHVQHLRILLPNFKSSEINHGPQTI